MWSSTETETGANKKGTLPELYLGVVMRSTILLCLFLCCSTSVAQSFDDLLNSVQNASSSEHQTLVNDFLAANPTSPIFSSDSQAVFIYSGQASSVGVAGDFNGWNPSNTPLTALGGSSLWYVQAEFELDARFDYKIVVNGSQWILDPRNASQVVGGFGPNSELSMPDYVHPEEITPRSGIQMGTRTSSTFESAVMGNSRSLEMYTPPGYDPLRSAPYPFILYHDGSDYLRLAAITTTLDNLISDGLIQPIIAAFLNPVDREKEYATTQTAPFTEMVVSELIPWIESNYHISPNAEERAVTGPSYGGLITTRQCFEHPEIFGLCGPYSPSYWVYNGALPTLIANSATKPIKWYLDWGTYEGSISVTGPSFRQVLEEKGYEHSWNEWHEGHSWGSWRAHQDEMLQYFFPGPNATSRSSLDLPFEVKMAVNYPNPFSQTTRFPIDLSEPDLVTLTVFDSLGRLVSRPIEKVMTAGKHELSFESGILSSGPYLYRVQVGNQVADGVFTILR